MSLSSPSLAHTAEVCRRWLCLFLAASFAHRRPSKASTCPRRPCWSSVEEFQRQDPFRIHPGDGQGFAAGCKPAIDAGIMLATIRVSSFESSGRKKSERERECVAITLSRFGCSFENSWTRLPRKRTSATGLGQHRLTKQQHLCAGGLGFSRQGFFGVEGGWGRPVQSFAMHRNT